MWRLVFSFSLLQLATGCSLDTKKENTTTVTLEIKDSRFSKDGARRTEIEENLFIHLNPTQLSDFQCLAVNVTGAKIPPHQGIMEKFRTSPNGDACMHQNPADRYPGKFFGFMRIQGGANFSMNLEPGEYHFQVFAIKSVREEWNGNVVCPSIQEILTSDGIAAATSKMFMVGETHANIGGATNIDIQAQMMRFVWPMCMGGNHFYNYTKITIGEEFMCGLRSGGTVDCWGDNSYGQLGIGTTGGFETHPRQVQNLSGMTHIAAGKHHVCAVDSSTNFVYCWGKNTNGQLGNGTTNNSSIPVSGSTGGMAPTSVAAGDDHSCAIVNATAYCWGKDANGQVGNDASTTDVLVPTSTSAAASLVAAGANHSCAWTSGYIKCWGANLFGQVGDGTTTQRNTPTDTTWTGTFISLSSGGSHSCATDSGFVTKCWGDYSQGQLGNNVGSMQTSATASPNTVAPFASGGQKVSTKLHHTCGLSSGGDIFCWGQNVFGTVGIGGDTNQPMPVQINVSGGTWTDIVAGYRNTCGKHANGWYCWGATDRGQLGFAGIGPLRIPIKLPD